MDPFCKKNPFRSHGLSAGYNEWDLVQLCDR
jgi:hypothetical protein